LKHYFGAIAMVLIVGKGALAGDPPAMTGSPSLTGAPSAPVSSPPLDLWHRDTLTGDWRGLRTTLADKGITFTASYIGEVFANVQGGMKRGTTYDGLFLPQIDVDMDKLVGWQGATFQISILEAHGQSIATRYLGNLIGISTIAAVPPSTRLYNFWLEQKLFGDALSIRAGLITVDEDFFNSTVAMVFMNPGWLGLGLPGGGPAYPLPTPGLRVRVNPGIEGGYLQAAVFSGDPTGGNGSTSPTIGIPSGTVISFSGGAFFIAECGYTLHQDKGDTRLPTTVKLGAWYHTSNHFGDQRYATNGLSLADPASTGSPYQHSGNWALYASLEGSLYRRSGGGELTAFARVGGSPADRNVIPFYAEAGVAYKGLIPTRDNDSLGLSVDYAPISNRSQGLDQDTRFFTGNPFFPIRDHELVLELTYEMQVTPWLTVQPDAQYVFNPGGHVLNNSSAVRPDALVFGLRSTITF
jgi:porin